MGLKCYRHSTFDVCHIQLSFPTVSQAWLGELIVFKARKLATDRVARVLGLCLDYLPSLLAANDILGLRQPVVVGGDDLPPSRHQVPNIQIPGILQIPSRQSFTDGPSPFGSLPGHYI